MCIPKKKGGLGFKNLSMFNTTLLAKQGWKIITQPNCLFARVMKVKYFPKREFLSARIASREPDAYWKRGLAGELGTARMSTSGMTHGYRELETGEFNVSKLISAILRCQIWLIEILLPGNKRKSERNKCRELSQSHWRTTSQKMP
ncbi:reverse transcriptase [Gossypium australe]|uniref:Reverse transcriptase n=1 Tax=Gossypium australe TaxID=47621 RepID=A0A5B6VQL9_9ROSI|nr:reverse transcriptase [Gossypium australe]